MSLPLAFALTAVLTATASAHGDPDVPCRGAPIPAELYDAAHPRHHHRAVRAMAGGDDITRTAQACKAPDGRVCDLCCDGVCCEDLSTFTQGFDAGVQMWVPLRFARVAKATPALSASARAAEEAAFEAKVREQLPIANAAFAPHRLWFYLAGVATHYSDSMAGSCDTLPCYTDAGCPFYATTMPTVRAGHPASKAVTVVVCDLSYYGEAQWPWAAAEDSPLHYVQLAGKAVGNGSAAYPGSRGKTLVHELGHYFGLMHIFERQGQCDNVGDWVGDTPASRSAASRSSPCGLVRDSCPSLAGHDDTDNYMNYVADRCMARFTPGQSDRMQRAIRRYRPRLYAATAVIGGQCRPEHLHPNACTCTNTTLRAADRCDGAVWTPPTEAPSVPTKSVITVGVVFIALAAVAVVMALCAAAAYLVWSHHKTAPEKLPRPPAEDLSPVPGTAPRPRTPRIARSATDDAPDPARPLHSARRGSVAPVVLARGGPLGFDEVRALTVAPPAAPAAE